jgi:hypothetical protein
MVELQLPKDWSVEADALYHPLRYDHASIPSGTLDGAGRDPAVIATRERSDRRYTARTVYGFDRNPDQRRDI